jgi:GH15 family glucan-1,4-alpha-glucosidase
MSVVMASHLPEQARRYPPIGDYGLIGDCHSAALVSSSGSIDWCCLPRFDSDSCFGRLLDWDKGGFFSIAPREPCEIRREYLGNTLILVTTFECRGGCARLFDFFAMRRGGRDFPRRELIRMLECTRGRFAFDVEIRPRLDFGEVKPWVHPVGRSSFMAVGSNTGLVVFGDIPLELADEHTLTGSLALGAGERRHIALRFAPPEHVHVEENSPDRDSLIPEAKPADVLEAHFMETREWWNDWAGRITHPGADERVIRSGIVLKALSYAPTGAIIAAPTTSLPEETGGERNWDYRFSWVRDSAFTVHALADLGCSEEANGFRRFIQRSAAGNADELQVCYAVDGKRRLTEVELLHMEGWRGSRPVRIGNAAAVQFQLDNYGTLLELSWRWSERGNSPTPHYWDFLVELVETTIDRWQEPDRGIWEIRSEPRHFVHSKVMCWAAAHRGIQLARAHRLDAPLERWQEARDAMRSAIEKHGYDARRGIFVQCFGGTAVDASLLLLPSVEFIGWTDPRMMRTAQAIHTDLDEGGFTLRYRTEDGLSGSEGVFLACSFWLAECLARQGRREEAREIFERSSALTNDLGLFSEEYEPGTRQLLGNFPQGLTHLAHISAALALSDRRA